MCLDSVPDCYTDNSRVLLLWCLMGLSRSHAAAGASVVLQLPIRLVMTTRLALRETASGRMQYGTRRAVRGTSEGTFHAGQYFVEAKRFSQYCCM